MDIDGMGEEIVRAWWRAGRLQRRGRLLHARRGGAGAAADMGRMNKDGEPIRLGQTVAKKLVAAIDAVAHAPVRPRAVRPGHAPRGQDHGRTAGCARIPTMDALMAATEEELAAGGRRGPEDRALHVPVPAHARQRAGHRAIARSTACAWPTTWRRKPPTQLPQTLEGLTFVLTGSLTQSGMTRDEAGAALKARGAKVSRQRVEEDQLRGGRRGRRQQVRQGRGAGRPRT